MGVDVTRSELLNRASILTIAEIEFFHAYFLLKKMQQVADRVGITYGASFQTKKRVEEILLGQAKNNTKRKNINNRDNFTTEEWSSRQKKVEDIVDKILEDKRVLRLLELGNFKLEYLKDKSKLNEALNHATKKDEINREEPTSHNDDDADGVYEKDPFAPKRINANIQKSSILSTLGLEKPIIEQEQPEQGKLGQEKLVDSSARTAKQPINTTTIKPEPEYSPSSTANTSQQTTKINSDDTNTTIAVFASEFNPITIKDSYIIGEALRLFGNVTILVLKSYNQSTYGIVKDLCGDDKRITVINWEKPEVEYMPYKNNIVHIKPMESQTNTVEVINSLEMNQIVHRAYKEIYVAVPNRLSCINSVNVVDMCKKGGDITNLLPNSVSRKIIQSILGG
mgnify:CR=1 FL=1